MKPVTLFKHSGVQNPLDSNSFSNGGMIWRSCTPTPEYKMPASYCRSVGVKCSRTPELSTKYTGRKVGMNMKTKPFQNMKHCLHFFFWFLCVLKFIGDIFWKHWYMLSSGLFHYYLIKTRIKRRGICTCLCYCYHARVCDLGLIGNYRFLFRGCYNASPR